MQLVARGGPTSVANSVDLKGVSGGQVSVFTANLALDAFHLAGEEFNRAAALGANHVMVVAAVVLVLVAGDAVIESNFACQAAVGEKLERAVDGSEADTLVFFAHETKKLVRREVFAGVEESSQDGVALLRVL